MNSTSLGELIHMDLVLAFCVLFILLGSNKQIRVAGERE